MKLFLYLATTTVSVSSLRVDPVQIDASNHDESVVPVQIGSSVQDESVIPVKIGASVQDESVIPVKIGSSVQDESVIPLKIDASVQAESIIPVVPIQIGSSIQDESVIPVHIDPSVQAESVIPVQIGASVQDESVIPVKIGASVQAGCYTKRNGKFEAKACVFPFLYKGASYRSCTTRDSRDEMFWCGTVQDVQVGEDGHVDTDHFGECDFAGSYCDVFPCLDEMDGTPVRTSCGHACAFRQGEGNGYCQADGTCWKTTWAQAFQACIRDGLVNSFEELVDFIPQDLLHRSG